MLKIAILGNSQESHETANWQKARDMAAMLSGGWHQIISAGSNGIASAAAAGVRQIHQVPVPGQFSHLRVLTDIGDSSNYFPSESNENDYFGNLSKLVMCPDIWVFFPGQDGTAQQLTSVLHLLRKGVLSLHYKWIVMMDSENPLINWGTAFLKMRDSKISWIVTDDIGRIEELIDDIEFRAMDLIVRVWQDSQLDGVMTSRELRQQVMMADPRMGYDLCERMINKAASYGDIKITDKRHVKSWLSIS
ncbi:hypothetical protein KKH39_03410 [Patescibacteria group bacterium]|nr:hypothetical protein [Patescibacteria group bacterium]